MKADEWYDLWTRTGNVVIGNVISDLRAVEQERDASRLLVGKLRDALWTMLQGDEMGEAECQRTGFPRLMDRREQARAALAETEGAGK